MENKELLEAEKLINDYQAQGALIFATVLNEEIIKIRNIYPYTSKQNKLIMYLLSTAYKDRHYIMKNLKFRPYTAKFMNGELWINNRRVTKNNELLTIPKLSLT